MTAVPIIAAVNPGSSSTKVGVFEADGRGGVLERGSRTVEHEEGRLRAAGRLWDQLPFRREAVDGVLSALGTDTASLAAAVGRGGLLPPLPGGTYRINQAMIADLRRGAEGEHASNLGAPLALALVSDGDRPAFVVDPVSVDEMEPVARLSGLPELPRVSLSHALNIRAMARRFAREQERSWEDVRLVVAHLGSGTSIAAIRGGRMVDVINPRDEGPFGTERAGWVPSLPLARLCFQEGASLAGVEARLFREGGLLAHLGTRDLREVRRRVDGGDAPAALVFDAMVCQVAKGIGSLATFLEGRLEAVILTGGLVRDPLLAEAVSRRVSFLGPVTVYPGEDELRALAEGAARVLAGLEAARPYPPAREPPS